MGNLFQVTQKNFWHRKMIVNIKVFGWAVDIFTHTNSVDFNIMLIDDSAIRLSLKIELL